MKQKSLLVLVEATPRELKEIKATAPGHLVVKKNDREIDYDTIEVIYGWDTQVDYLKKCPQLKWIQAPSAGVNQFNMSELKTRDILLTNASGVHGNQMSESILGMIFMHTRQLKTALLNQEKGQWQPDYPMTDLVGKKVLVFGTGHIGKHLAEVLTVFGAEIYGVNRSGYEVSPFQQVMAIDSVTDSLDEMDIIITLLPETDATKYFFNKSLFEKMKQGVIFVNAGRGSAVDKEALIEACESGKVGFAGLDVFEEEPLPQTDLLWKTKNVFITPHTSGRTDQYIRRLHPIFLRNLGRFVTEGTLLVNEITYD